MSSIMGVQRAATARNQRAEKVSLYLFSKLADSLGAVPPSPQARFTSSIAQDIWDTKLLFDLDGAQGEIWSQTTCYKGHGNPSQPEANKGYEFRETITELISLLATHDQAENIRTVHITYGNYRYAYPWMHHLKGHLFDSSIVLNLANSDIHEAIDNAIGSLVIESQVFKKLDDERQEKTELGLSLDIAIRSLSEWASKGFIRAKLGRSLAAIVRENLENLGSSGVAALRPVSIKSRIVNILLGKTTGDDPILVRAADEFLLTKPFLLAGRSYLSDWNEFREILSGLPNHAVNEFVQAGWQSKELPFRTVFRRLIARVGITGDVNYVQDFDVQGVTEHNLYIGNHNEAQARSISDVIASRLNADGLENPLDITEAILLEGRSVLESLMDYEVRNGTNAKYAESVVLSRVKTWGYKISPSPTKAGFPATGFHVSALAELEPENAESRPQPFTNFVLVSTPEGKPICYLKTKYFREQEFERRAKEESFVSMTVSVGWENGLINTGGSLIPTVMYVDTDDDPSSTKVLRALLKMKSFGWKTCLSFGELQETLESIVDGR